MPTRLVAAIFIFFLATWLASAANWPAWRGPLGTGISLEKDLPTQWNRTNHIKWRTALPEPGNSTPIAWQDRIFVTQAAGKQRTLMCFQRSDGTLLWQSGITTREVEPTHAANPHCAPSPVTDGERVIVSFSSDGVYCYDFAGKEQWHRDDLGRQIHIWGGGPSPVIHGNICFLNFGPGETTYLIAMDKKTGQTIWKRDEATGYEHLKESDKSSAGKTYIGSWTTPTLMPADGRVPDSTVQGLDDSPSAQLLMSWPKRLVAYEPASGKELWSCAGLNPLVYTSPIYGEGIVVTMGGFNGASFAVRAGGSGDVTESRRQWYHPKTKQRIGSGVIHDGYIYIHNDPGVAECYELKAGKLVWEERLKGPGASGVNWSSILLADGNCYTITQGGDCFVFEASPKFQLVSVNPLGEPSNSSIIASDGELFIRTHKALWCVK